MWATAALTITQSLSNCTHALASSTSEIIACTKAQLEAAIADKPFSAELEYLGTEGQKRYFKNGSIWELRNDFWIHIGLGHLNGEKVIEDYLGGPNLPDLRALKRFQHQISTESETAWFPNENERYPSTIKVIQIANRKIQVIAPTGFGLEGALDGTVSTVLELPYNRIDSLLRVRLNPNASKHDALYQRHYKDFTNAISAARWGEIDIFPIRMSEFAQATEFGLRATRHEFGHLIAGKLYGTGTPNQSYATAASNDRTSVSNYGNNNLAEDFAEGIEAYLRTHAGTLKPEVRAALKNRFSFFDDIFNNRAPQSAATHLQKTKSWPEKNLVFVKMIDAKHLLALAPAADVGLLLEF